MSSRARSQRSQTTPLTFDFNAKERKIDLSGTFAASVSEESAALVAEMVELDKLKDNPYQPRFGASEDGLRELADVLRRQGFQGVLVARPHPDPEELHRGVFQLSAGHRRRDAARLASFDRLPVVVRELTDEQMAAIAITENIQREDLNPLEEGRLFALMRDQMGYTQERIAEEIGKDRGYVVNRLRLAEAPPDVQKMLEQRPDTVQAVRYIVKIKDESLRAEAIKGVLAGELTTRDLPSYVETLTTQAEASEQPLSSPAEPAGEDGEGVAASASGAGIVERGFPESAPSANSDSSSGKILLPTDVPGQFLVMPAESTLPSLRADDPDQRPLAAGTIGEAGGATPEVHPARTAEAVPISREDRTRWRVRTSRLMSVVSQLRKYREVLLRDVTEEERRAIEKPGGTYLLAAGLLSEAEQELLAELGELVDELRLVYGRNPNWEVGQEVSANMSVGLDQPMDTGK